MLGRIGGPPERRASAIIFKTFGKMMWSMVMGYGRRWAVETAFSTYKRLYEENTISRNIENKSIHIQHTNKHTDNIITDEQKKKTDRKK